MVKEITIKCDPKEISDGYHTIGELYEHRHALYLLAMKLLPSKSWFSRQHEDGTMFDGMFIAGMDLPEGTITYHLPNCYIDCAHHTGAEEMKRGKPWGGYTSRDVIERIEDFILHNHKRSDANNEN